MFLKIINLVGHLSNVLLNCDARVASGYGESNRSESCPHGFGELNVGGVNIVFLDTVDHLRRNAAAFHASSSFQWLCSTSRR